MRTMAALALAMALPLGARAQAGPSWEWTHPTNQHPFCRLFVQQVAQDNPDQPLRFTIRNDSNGRVAYAIAVNTRGSAGRQLGTVQVDSASMNEVSMAATGQAFRGQVQAVQLTLRNCERVR